MVTRRRFMQWIGAAGAAAAAVACARAPVRNGAVTGRVVVVGGGFGGATCARYLRRFAPNLAVTLIEPQPQFISCPFSNAVIAGWRDMRSITHSYDGLRGVGVEVFQDWAEVIDPARREVRLKGGKVLTYDRLVVSPGIDFRFDTIEGYSPAIAETIPHAWKAGEQTKVLRRQIEAMADGGVVIIAVPGDPYRCPPGPYERAGLIAHYLRRHKPRSKVLILDTKDTFPKQPLFMEGWQQLYPGYVEWVPGSDGGKVERVDAKTRTVGGGFGVASRKGDVINLIPAQRAGAAAVNAGLADASGWCPVDPRTFESTLQAAVYVIGDACTAGPMPKSAYAANSQAKACAAAIASALEGGPLPEPSYLNTCYSLLAEDYGISVAGVYRVTEAGITAVEGAGGVSPLKAGRDFRKKEAAFTRAWYESIIADSFALEQRAASLSHQ